MHVIGLEYMPAKVDTFTFYFLLIFFPIFRNMMRFTYDLS